MKLSRATHRLVLALVMVWSAILSKPDAVQCEQGYLVLILHSYHKAAWTDALLSGIESMLKELSPVEYRIEYMDTKRLNSETYLQSLANSYKLKYEDVHFDAIITSDDNAFHFALRQRKVLFSQTPIVFCGVNRFDQSMLSGHPNVTGVVEKGDFKDTLAVAMKMRPHTKAIYVIDDSTRTGRINKHNFQKVVAEIYPAITVTYANDQSLAQLRKQLESLTSEYIAFFISFWQDGRGKKVSPDDLETVFKKSAVPVFGRSEWMLGRGMTGGKCVSGFHQGAAAAGLVKRILMGVDPETIPVIQDSPNKFMFDYLEIKKHAIPMDTLPVDSIVFNRPKTFYEVHKTTALVGLVFSSLLFTAAGAMGLFLQILGNLLFNNGMLHRFK